MESADLLVLRAAQQGLIEGETVLLVTVVKTWGSSPRPVGSMLAIRDDGVVVGSVSGGCIEDDLLHQAKSSGIASLTPDKRPRLVTYGLNAEEATRFGLPCGGTLQLVLEPLHEGSQVHSLIQALERRQIVRRELNLDDGAVQLHPAQANDEASSHARALSWIYGPRYRLLVIGGGQLSQYFCQTALGLDFDITVCDPRAEYADNWNVPGVTLSRQMPDDLILQMMPDERTAVVALTHDPKLDDLAIMDALRTPAFYVGALGSRANNRKRRERLQEHFDLTEDELARLRGPAGLYIGSRTPMEIAISILAEIIAVKNAIDVPSQFDIATTKNAVETPPCSTQLETTCGDRTHA